MNKIVLEDFYEGDGYFKVNLAYLTKEQVEEIESLVSKWNPTDEDIKSCIGMCLTDANEQRFKDYGTNLKDCLAWLEKQSENNKWKPSKDEMDALYGLAYITNKMDDKKDEAITKLYQDLKREFFNGSSYENMFPNTEDGVRRSSTIQVLEYARSLDTYNQFGKADIDKNIAWLEKQGDKSQGKTALEAIHEEKVDNAIKVEPTFNVGDWITFYGGKPFKILKVESEQNGILDYLLLDQNGHDSYYNKKYVDENARLWTIQDAKDGDVLAWYDSKCIALFKNIYDDVSFNSHGFVGHCTGAFESRLPYHDIEGTHPANKEQYDLLFKKMKEAGYEWDDKKRELKKIESFPNSAKTEKNWSAGDEELMRHCYDALDVASYHSITKEDKEELIEWIKSLKQRIKE